MKYHFCFFIALIFSIMTNAQTVRYKDAYGDKVVYIDGNTLRAKDAYGEKLYFVDNQTIRYKDAYGDKLYYFEGIPEKWVIICLIRLYV